MPKPRREQVCLDITQNYHIVARCVRREFLCGTFGKKNYEHRKEWIESKLAELVDIFAIQLYGYAIMSNHYHLVVHINHTVVGQWSDREVAQRWLRLFKGNVLAKRFAESGNLSNEEWATLEPHIAIWRERLCDVSWFMRVLNEFIARAANKEENCSGRFWEGRYKSQALLGMDALLAAMVYVDLNPVRAKIAKSIDDSEFTSGLQRLNAVRTSQTIEEDVPTLVPLHDRADSELPLSERGYLELLDYSGRLIKEGKAGFIAENQPAILSHIKISTDQWRSLCKDFESPFRQFVGSYRKLKQACKSLGKISLHGLGSAKRLFPCS